METMGISLEIQATVFQLVAGILHLGNIGFVEEGNYAKPENDDCMFFNTFLPIKFSRLFQRAGVGCTKPG